jgi:hypothetical protein
MDEAHPFRLAGRLPTGRVQSLVAIAFCGQHALLLLSQQNYAPPAPDSLSHGAFEWDVMEAFYDALS